MPVKHPETIAPCATHAEFVARHNAVEAMRSGRGYHIAKSNAQRRLNEDLAIFLERAYGLQFAPTTTPWLLARLKDAEIGSAANSVVPDVIARYFAKVNEVEQMEFQQPLVCETYRPGKGWSDELTPRGARPVATMEALRRLRRQGVTAVHVVAYNHGPDFQMAELFR